MLAVFMLTLASWSCPLVSGDTAMLIVHTDANPPVSISTTPEFTFLPARLLQLILGWKFVVCQTEAAGSPDDDDGVILVVFFHRNRRYRRRGRCHHQTVVPSHLPPCCRTLPSRLQVRHARRQAASTVKPLRSHGNHFSALLTGLLPFQFFLPPFIFVAFNFLPPPPSLLRLEPALRHSQKFSGHIPTLCRELCRL